MPKTIGTVISSFEGPSTFQFNFVIKEDSGEIPVHKGQFIQTKTEQGILIGRVDEVIKMNRYFMQAESVREYEKSGKPLMDMFPVDRWEYLVAKTTTLGIYDDGLMKRVTYPPSPGINVEVIDTDILSKFLGLDEKGLNVGKIVFHDLDAKVNLTKLFHKHLAILAISGAGKCLSPNTLVTLSSGKLAPIHELFDSYKCLSGIKREDNIEFCEPKNLEVVTLKKNEISKSKVKAVTRRKLNENIIKITTKTGKSLFLTKDHPLMSFEIKPKWKSVRNLQENSWIALPSLIRVNTKQQIVNLISEIKNEDGFYAVKTKNLLLKLKNKCGVYWNTIAKNINVSKSTLQYWRKTGTIPIKKLFQLANLTNTNIEESIHHIKFKTSTPINSKIVIDGDFARFLGYLFGDAHNDGKTLRFTNSKVEIVKDFCRLAEKIIKKPYLRRSKGSYECIIFCETIAQIMNKIFGLKHSSRKKDISDAILSSPNHIVAQFLRAIYDCDGYCSDKKPELELTISNEKIIPKIENLLLRFGIYSVVKMKKRLTQRGKKEYFYFYVRGVENLRKFRQIGFTIDYKKQRLEKHLKLRSNPNIDIIPSTPLFYDALEKLNISQSSFGRISGTSQPNISMFIRGNRCFSKQTFKKIMNTVNYLYANKYANMNGAFSQDIKTLNDLCEGEIFWDKIESIKKIKPKFNYVYDLVLEDSHNFIANNVIVHNSHLVSVFLEELLDRSDDMGKPAIVVIDPHGEYAGFAEDKNYSKRTRVFDMKSLSIGVSSLSPYQISEFVPEISAVQRRELNKIVNKLKKDKKDYSLDDLLDEIEKSEMKNSTKNTLMSWISNLEMNRIFSKYTRPSVYDLAKAGQLSVIDLSGFTRLKDKQIIVTYFARKLFNARHQEKIPPFIFIVEESHQFCPEGVEREGAISKSIIQTIAREGRKFHASLVLISQRPIQLSTTALSQCNSQILLKIVNPYDLKHIQESSEAITSDLIKSLPGLQVGEAIITGNAVNHPLFVQVRQRKSKESSRLGMSFEDAIASYNDGVKTKEKDLDTFM